MRLTLWKRLFAVLLCCCMLFTSGCFPVHSIVGKEEYKYVGSSGSLDLDVSITNQKQAVSGVYPKGTRAFKFKNCTYEADISDFRIIDICGNVSLYYYTGITVLHDKPDENGNTENKKGYYDPNDPALDFEYFWTIAGYNFVTGHYFEIMSHEYDPVGDAGKMNGNPVVTHKSSDGATYVINVGYYFILFSVGNAYDNSSQGQSTDSMNYALCSRKIWQLSGDNKKSIRDYLDIKGDKNTFCCTDLAVKNLEDSNDLKFAASFMKLPDDSEESYDQDNVMMEVRLKTDNDGNRSIQLHKKSKGLKTVNGGNILSSNYVAGNCVYVLNESSSSIKFGIDNRDRKTSFKVDLSDRGKDNGNNVLQSFSVENWVYQNGGNDVISNEESLLELVFKNRVEYYQIQRNEGAFGVIKYKAVHQATYPLSSFCSTYLSSDDIPSVGYYSHGINLSSTTEGFKCINSSGDTVWSSVKGADFCSFAYGDKTAIVGFNDFTFDKTVQYFDDSGKQTGISKSKSEFTLAQLPFATVRIV